MCVTVEVISTTFCILFHLCCKLVPSLTRMVSIGLIIIIVWSTGWSLIALHWLVLKCTKLNIYIIRPALLYNVNHVYFYAFWWKEGVIYVDVLVLYKAEVTYFNQSLMLRPSCLIPVWPQVARDSIYTCMYYVPLVFCGQIYGFSFFVERFSDVLL